MLSFYNYYGFERLHVSEILVILFHTPRRRLNLMGQSKHQEPHLLDLAKDRIEKVRSWSASQNSEALQF